jgi:hypothetical protein
LFENGNSKQIEKKSFFHPNGSSPPFWPTAASGLARLRTALASPPHVPCTCACPREPSPTGARRSQRSHAAWCSRTGDERRWRTEPGRLRSPHPMNLDAIPPLPTRQLSSLSSPLHFQKPERELHLHRWPPRSAPPRPRPPPLPLFLFSRVELAFGP